MKLEEVLKVAVFSTLHITKQDAKNLEYYAKAQVEIMEDEYGWWIPVNMTQDQNYRLDDDNNKQVFSNSLFKLLEFGKDNGCSHIRIDYNGFEYDCLERYGH